MGALSYRVWYFASLQYDEDQRNNDINARRQQVQILFAQQQQASSWFNPELLAIPLDTVRSWMDANADLAVYRFAIESLFHEQEHVLDEQGERLLSYRRPLQQRAVRQLLGADDGGHEVPVDHAGERRARSRSPTASTGRCSRRTANQDDRATAYRAFHQTYADNQNTYAALYNGVLQRDWFHARARGYKTTLDAALHGNDIPTSVVENLIAVTKQGVEPLRRYHRLRRRVLGASTAIGCSTSSCRWSSTTRGMRTTRSARGSSIRWRRSAREYQQHVRGAFDGALDRRVREQRQAQRRVFGAGVRRASVHAAELQRDARRGVHAGARDGPLDAHAAVAPGAAVRLRGLHDLRRGSAVDAERGAVPRLHARARRRSRDERVVLLQHAIDSIASTFYTQVMFADFELQAHRLVEQDQPITAEALNDIYARLLREYYGDVIDEEQVSRVTWARIPHFFSTPYYVYQYATCFASTARLMQDLPVFGPARSRAAWIAICRCCAPAAATIRWSCSPAGVDLSQPDTVRAVATELDMLVSQLEAALK